MILIITRQLVVLSIKSMFVLIKPNLKPYTYSLHCAKAKARLFQLAIGAESD